MINPKGDNGIVGQQIQKQEDFKEGYNLIGDFND